MKNSGVTMLTQKDVLKLRAVLREAVSPSRERLSLLAKLFSQLDSAAFAARELGRLGHDLGSEEHERVQAKLRAVWEEYAESAPSFGTMVFE